MNEAIARGSAVRWVRGVVAMVVLVAGSSSTSLADDLADLDQSYATTIQPLLRTYCYECHSGDLIEAEVDFESFVSIESLRKKLRTWQRVGDMVEGGQMPPREAKPLPAADRETLQTWVDTFLQREARARAGDPGRVVLRRLDNASYTYTIRDLTGVDSLDPAKEFPADSGAGEGFTNTGNALVMSPSLVTKYFDAAKAIADHAVLLPDGFRFSPMTSRRDWTEESLAKIRGFYGKYSVAGGGSAVNLQGIQFNTNEGGRLPVEAYLAALLASRDALAQGKTTTETVARDHHLNAKYLGTLWQAVFAETDAPRSLLVERLHQRCRTASPADAPAIAAEIERWQEALWSFNSIGHIGRTLGRKDGPQSWMEAVSPIASRRDVQVELKPAPGSAEMTIYLVASNAGDGSENDVVVWENPRLVAPGRPDLPLRDLRQFALELARKREQILSGSSRYLAAVADMEHRPEGETLAGLAERRGLEPPLLAAWAEFLGIGAETSKIESYLTDRSEKSEAYDFIKGWVGADALSVVANSSDEHVRTPGNMKPHSVAVHPSPSRRALIAWKSPSDGTIAAEGVVQHAHPECGNGVAWSLELRRGKTRQRLASGVAQGGSPVPIAPINAIAVRRGDLVAMVVSPRDGNHSCDLTAIDLAIRLGDQRWDLAGDVSSNLLAGNPHADSLGNADVWHFGSEPDGGGSATVIPAGSILARWQASPSPDERRQLADDLQAMLQNKGQGLAENSPDRALYQQLTSLSGPLLSSVGQTVAADPKQPDGETAKSTIGLDPSRFGTHPSGAAVDPRSLCVRAPSILAVTLPAELVQGCTLVTAGTLHEASGHEGSVQVQVLTTEPGLPDLLPGLPVIVAENSEARERFSTAFHDVRSLFPPALCYSRIVPIDEVVTLNLYYREDDHLQRLMLNDAEIAEIDRLWDEMLYISQEPLLLATAFEQIAEFATQDRPDMVSSLEPMRGPVNDRAAAFRKRLVATEPAQVDALIAFAARAYRRPLRDDETRQLRDLYATFRQEEIAHDEALRLTLARVLIAPAFLYRVEEPAPGASPQPVTSYELASRLSYLLWSSMPDADLTRAADEGRLQDPAVLLEQTRRMVRDARTRRLASEFSAQWLHVHNFDQIDEKSESVFPTFGALKSAMYEETIAFLTDLFQNDRPVLNLLDADYTFLNEDLATHYGIPGVTGPEWRKVEGVRSHGRGGVLTMATTLATQSGASRTSPILRGNWLNEVILGDRLPRPPKNVPVLPETTPEGLTERQLIEQHSANPSCARCHVRIDPMGFALENYDAIGRFRREDAAGLPIDSTTALPDGTKINGVDGLRAYLTGDRREAFLRQFNRKLLGYALGRSVQLSDEPLLAAMHDALVKNDYRVSAALESVILSKQFREIRGRDQAAEE